MTPEERRARDALVVAACLHPKQFSELVEVVAEAIRAAEQEAREAEREACTRLVAGLSDIGQVRLGKLAERSKIWNAAIEAAAKATRARSGA
jgi:hypothetical protein